MLKILKKILKKINMKKFFFYSLLIIFNSFLFGITFLLIENYSKKKINEIQFVFHGDDLKFNKERTKFYKKYSQKLHHLRDFNLVDFFLSYDGGYNEYMLEYYAPENFMFTTLSKGETEVLIQGDSWAQQMIFEPIAREYLLKVAKKHNYKIVGAGTSSYSPSPMTAQINIMKEDFNINPKIVIAVFDQTDLGDELYRYRSKREFINGDNLIVKPETNHLEAYSLIKPFKKIDILYNSNLNIIKLIQFKLLDIEDYFLKKKFKGQLKWKDIVKPLINQIDKNDKDYLVQVIDDYINEVFKNKNTEKLYIATHFHKNHAKEIYKNNIYDLTKVAAEKSIFKENIILINHSVNDNKFNIDEVFIENDPSSHLKQYHVYLYTKKIFESILKK